MDANDQRERFESSTTYTPPHPPPPHTPTHTQTPTYTHIHTNTHTQSIKTDLEREGVIELPLREARHPVVVGAGRVDRHATVRQTVERDGKRERCPERLV